MKGPRNSSRTTKKLLTDKTSTKKYSVKNLPSLNVTSVKNVRNSYEESTITTTVQSEPMNTLNTSISFDNKGNSTIKMVRYAPKINIDLQNTMALGNVSSKTIRKVSPTDKKVPMNNTMYNSLNKEIKINTRNKILKGTNSPSFFKGSVDNPKKNMRYNSNSYSSSFCQNLVASNSNKDKLLIEGASVEVDLKNESKKSFIEPYGKEGKKSIKTMSNNNIINANKSVNLSGFSNLKAQLQPKKSIEMEPPSDKNPMNNFIELFERINTLLTQTKEELNSLNNDNLINSSILVKNIGKLAGDIEEIYQKVRSRNTSSENKATLEQEEEIYESTKFNLNLIKSSSERRDSIYRKFFNICIENMKDITGMISSANISPKANQIPIKVEQNITNNIINNHTSNANNVNVNVNVNVNTINTNTNTTRDKNHLKKISRMISRKKISKHQFHNFNNSPDEDGVDLSESMMCEGANVKMPVKSYIVNKPKEDHMNYRVFTEGDLYDSDDSDDIGVTSGSEILNFVESHRSRGELGRDEDEDDKFKRFKKNRSKSLLELKKQRGFGLTGNEKDKKKEVITLFQDVSISKIDIEDSDSIEEGSASHTPNKEVINFKENPNFVPQKVGITGISNTCANVNTIATLNTTNNISRSSKGDVEVAINNQQDSVREKKDKDKDNNCVIY